MLGLIFRETIVNYNILYITFKIKIKLVRDAKSAPIRNQFKFTPGALTASIGSQKS